ncbi:hypothetical protein LSAT2_028696 [Lamellibrachia satsuma]|nr:hypothetical protein LSAT2_028696 [Lamellibrachia satsuma]
MWSDVITKTFSTGQDVGPTKLVVDIGYVCGDCSYSPCDVTCGPGKKTGTKHCVLFGTDMASLLEENDTNCPTLDCFVPCSSVATTTLSDDVTAGTTTDETTATSSESVVVNLDYTCEECQYSSCDVTCGEGERSGSKHCVLYDIDLTTIIDEHDVKCPPEACTVQCDMGETTTAFTSMTSQGQLPNIQLHLNYSCDSCVYSSCAVTCGPGVQFGSMHCVLIDEDTATVLDEYDIKCPNLECNTTCTTTESAPIETPTVSDDTVTPDGTTTTADETTAGTVSTWDEWTECTKSCGGGIQFRQEWCNGVVCNSEMAACNSMPCYDPYAANPWSNCSAPCDGGMRIRIRDDMNAMVRIPCNLQPCGTVFGNCPADLVFVLDSSADVGDLIWYMLKQYTIDIMQSLKISDDVIRVGVISYSTKPRIDVDLGALSDTRELTEAVWAVEYMAGITNTADALAEAHWMLERRGRPDATKLIVLLTDCGTTSQPPDTLEENVASITNDDINIFAIGVTRSSETELKNMILGVEHVFHLSSPFQQVLRALNDSTCTSKTLF